MIPARSTRPCPRRSAGSASSAIGGWRGVEVSGEMLSAPYVLEYPYRRSCGPVIGRFLAGLQARRIFGVCTADRRVLVPPAEYDDHGEPTGALVEVGQSGVVVAWAWIDRPRPNQPLDRPFAWALVKLDGASTALIHAVDAGSADRMATGMRVRVRWRAERTGSIRDIECFEPGEASQKPAGTPPPDPLRRIETPIRLEYRVVAGHDLSRFLGAVAEGRLVGRRCPGCRKVYVPPRGGCPTCALALGEEVPVRDTGTVTTFCVVNIP